MTPRGPTSVVLCAAIAFVVMALEARPGAQWNASGGSPVLAAYEAWLGGDGQAITQRFADAAAFQTNRSDLQRVLRLWVRDWKPSQAAFLLELSLVAFDRQWSEAPQLLSGTRDLVVGRRNAPGTNAQEDDFERAFHRAAVTFFLSRQLLAPAHAYMTALAGRVDLTPSTSGKPRLVDPWITFARATANDINTSPGLRPAAGPATGGLDTLVIAPDDRALRTVAEAAVSDYARLDASAEVAAEAAVRRGLLLFRLGRADEAMTAFAAADAAEGDLAIRYWTTLFRGRTLEGLDRVEEAAAAYERAASLVPDAQTPAIALAALWHRRGRPDEAGHWATRALAAPGGFVDPWFSYWYGDLRFAGERLDTLRRARP